MDELNETAPAEARTGEVDPAGASYTLKSPVIFQGHRYDQLEFREPSGEDLEILDRHKGAVRGQNALVAHLAGVPPEVVKKMAARDVTGAGKVVNELLGNDPLD